MGKKQKQKEKKVKSNFTHKLEGKKAVDALAEAMDKDGLLVDENVIKDNFSTLPEEEITALKKRIRKMEQEVDLLKDLLARALKVNKQNVLKG